MPETETQGAGEAKQFIELDPKDFKLKDYDNVHIDVPAKPKLTDEDIDAQLFEYVASAGKNITSIADLDDAWVQDNFQGLETIDDVRKAIQDDYDRNMEFEIGDIKYQACADVLIERLEGEVPEDLLDHNTEAMHEGNERRLSEMHISMQQYLREEHLTPDQYDDKVRAEALRQMKLNVALDLMADVLNMQVGLNEITDYLSAPNPEAFITEIREKGLVEGARRAAVRVKVMRRVVDTAVITVINEDGEPIPEPEPEPVPAPEEDEDFEMPDFENLPTPHIRDDKTDPDTGLSLVSE